MDSLRAVRDFNPRSPHGERLRAEWAKAAESLFQPTLPARGATAFLDGDEVRLTAISTHAPRTGSDYSRMTIRQASNISTHAPRTGSDAEGERLSFAEQQISTHAPRTGSDLGTQD